MEIHENVTSMKILENNCGKALSLNLIYNSFETLLTYNDSAELGY